MSLRTIAVRGGLYLVLRQGLGVAISAVGLILLTRVLGPEDYGIWAAALGIYAYLSNLSGWGVNVYLIRREGELSEQDYHQAFSVLLLLGLAGAGLASAALPLLELWVNLEGFGPLALALFVGLPVSLVASVPSARLERALDYRKVALVELSGLVIFYPVALPLAYEGLGPWAPLAGWWATQLLTLVLVFWTSGYRPRLCWERARVRAMVRYGVGFSASEWIWSLGKLVNPLIVGRYAGAEAVGQVALATRLVEQLSYVVLLPVARLAIPVFARLREDRGRLTKALNEGTALQLLVIGPVLVGFGLVAPWIVPLLLGSQWLPALEVYPFIAAAYLSGATVSLHSSVLFTLGKLWQIAVTRIAHVVLFAGSALVLVPRLGLKGYGWADMVALPSYVLLLIWVWAYVGKPISAETLVWLACWILALFAWQLGPWAWAILLVPLIWPSTRREVPRAAATVLASISKR